MRMVACYVAVRHWVAVRPRLFWIFGSKVGLKSVANLYWCFGMAWPYFLACLALWCVMVFSAVFMAGMSRCFVGRCDLIIFCLA